MKKGGGQHLCGTRCSSELLQGERGPTLLQPVNLVASPLVSSSGQGFKSGELAPGGVHNFSFLISTLFLYTWRQFVVITVCSP
jgi:hypothetical protein